MRTCMYPNCSKITNIFRSVSGFRVYFCNEDHGFYISGDKIIWGNVEPNPYQGASKRIINHLFEANIDEFSKVIG